MTRIALTIAFVALAGCSSSTSPKPAPTSDSSAPTGWRAVVGEGGTFVHTFDEHDWTVRSLGNVDLYGVSCIGNDVGWAVGAHGVIAHTEDGGRTWSWQSSGTTTSLRAVAFDDLTHGIAVGDDGFVRTTIDGGQRWDAPLAGGEALPLRAAWANGCPPASSSCRLEPIARSPLPLVSRCPPASVGRCKTSLAIRSASRSTFSAGVVTTGIDRGVSGLVEKIGMRAKS